MATPQLSPGVISQEVDLTLGRVDNVVSNVGALAGPFPVGPINEPVVIENEAQLLDKFGQPKTTDEQYEYWMACAEYLSYGGIMQVVRVDGDVLNNSNAGVGTDATTVKIKNKDNYDLFWDSEGVDFYYASRNPGTWADGLKVCVIDNGGDQIINYSNGQGTPEFNNIAVGAGITTPLNGTLPGAGTTSEFDGYLKAIVTGVNTATGSEDHSFDVRIVSRVSYGTTGFEQVLAPTVLSAVSAGVVTVSLNDTTDVLDTDTFTGGGLVNAGISSVTSSGIELSVGVTTSIPQGTTVRINRYVITPEEETEIDQYNERDYFSAFQANQNIGVVGLGTTATGSINTIRPVDWYDNQKLELTNADIFWRQIASKPTTNQWVANREGKDDAVHIVVVDDNGEVTGTQGAILERYISVSKALDAVSAVNSPDKIFWKEYVSNNSSYVFPGRNPSNAFDGYWGINPTNPNFTSGFSQAALGAGVWGQKGQKIKFSVVGNLGFPLTNGADYQAGNSFGVSLSDISAGYERFRSDVEVDVDYLIMGPSMGTMEESQAKAGKLIDIASDRKDCIAVISAHKGSVVGIDDSNSQTKNIINFFSPLASSSYTVFDAGYKYVYDRFNNKFIYMGCNSDVAGCMVRTATDLYPWFSPAGTSRGAINNAVKLAYNPTKSQRDQLYATRINPVVNLPGQGIVLYGDKTAIGYASAFDRINVRQLFLTVEEAIEGLAQDILFEFNDAITRTSFANSVVPYLQDVQAKRGLTDFRVICDETNNTPDVIDNNEFRADIFIKPNKVINYVTLTFVATKEGLSFEEITGRV